MSTEQLYNQKAIDAIETLFGPYQQKPQMKLTPNLYKKYGAWGQTTYIRESRLPILIEIDEDLFDKSPLEGMTTVVHEMLEWRGIERGESFPHQFAETHQTAILPVAMLTPLDYILQRHPLLSVIIRGY